MGRDIGAASRAIGVAPAVILAFEFAALVDADGQADAAMQAAVFPDVDIAVVGPPDGEFAAEKLALVDVAEGKVLAGGYGIPRAVGEGERPAQ